MTVEPPKDVWPFARLVILRKTSLFMDEFLYGEENVGKETIEVFTHFNEKILENPFLSLFRKDEDQIIDLGQAKWYHLQDGASMDPEWEVPQEVRAHADRVDLRVFG